MWIAFMLIIVIILFLRNSKGNSKLTRKRHSKYWTLANKTHKKIRQYDDGRRVFYAIRNVNPYVFEELILVAFKSIGYKIKRSKRYSGDGGIDGEVKINGEWCFIQAKRYSDYINPQHVSDFKTLCDQRRKKGFFIHTGKTGRKALNEAGESVVIISGRKLTDLLQLSAQKRSLFDRGYLQKKRFEIMFSPKRKKDA
uniref:Restriction endonuclease type IV Mrr domain-containing protein n=2 Tax=Vibrionaceae TaxID=641 RepID=A0A0H3ZV08_VIBSP|nr:hypothetical protein [Vibrio splendidus]AKN40581.1 putative membrane protein [Enterovibrio norvegicus]